MAAPNKHRENIVSSATRLFRQRGYAATGLNDILAASGAPKGSLYHYFPEGKEQLGEEAVRLAGGVVVQTLRRLRAEHATAAQVMRGYAVLLAGWMADSGFSDGCPIATTMLETAPQSARLSAAGRDAFGAWRAELESMLVVDGLGADEARRLALLAVAAYEGALIQARVEASPLPITEALEELALLLESRCQGTVVMPSPPARGKPVARAKAKRG